MKFWMFMQKWGSRQDELKIFYRTNPGLPWVLLQSFTQSVSSWTLQTIDLPSDSSEIQIGFGGNARWALGICIDDIEITGTPLPTLSVLPANRIASMSAGMTTFSVTCPYPWTATSDAPSWCTVTQSGTGNGTITATYAGNTLYAKRTANITVSADGMPAQTVTVTQDASNISVGEISSGGIRLYPNPARGFLRIIDENGTNQIREITLVDFTGRVVLSRQGSGENEFEFDLSSLSQGTYTVRLKGEHALVNRKLVIIR